MPALSAFAKATADKQNGERPAGHGDLALQYSAIGGKEGDGFLEPPGQREEGGVERVAVGAGIAAADQIVEAEAGVGAEDFGSWAPWAGSRSR